jgi:transcriptional regulator with XRE-family HTH domain
MKPKKVTALRAAREKRRWSQAELARQAGLNHQTVHMIENGRLVPFPGQVKKLAKALGVSVNTFEKWLREAEVE